MDYMFSAMLDVFSPVSLLFMLGGVIIGTIFGAIPGLTSTMGVALFVPITFGLDPVSGILLLIGVYYGGVSGGLVSATLLGIPGTPSSIATTFDAFPMAKQGEPVRALGIGITASFIGGIFSFLALITISPIVSRYAVMMGPFEYAALTVFALTLIVVLSKGNLIKGIASGLVGIAIAMIGFSPIDGTARFTFDVTALKAGISLLPLIMGLFALSQIHHEIRSGQKQSEMNLKVSGLGISLGELLGNTWNLVRSSLIGIGFGILPGLGSGSSNLVAYAQAKQASKDPESFGKGNPAGIYASESSNNAAVGGALIPMLTLGIPGDTVTAIMLGGFMIHGIQPGPLLFTSNPDIVYTVFIGFLVAIIMVFLLQMFGMRLFPKILNVPANYLYPILLVLTVVGAYTTNSTMFDVWVMLVFGAVGYFMMQNNYPIAPLILGFVLAPILETYTRRALMYSGNVLDFFTRPVSAIFLSLALIMLIITIIKEYKEIAKKEDTVPL
ncbi:tripartite tricarboxylate transporter permease [Brevibacillus sp. TJ4]|uniref:tripartite tricarboxylate transporter permease n=1 Tax=Brevibacillus sp. TJ4 TaxID=3234853 RepID=UPI003BA1BA6D